MMITSCVFLAVFFGTWGSGQAEADNPEDTINNLATDFCTLDIYHEALQNELHGWLTTSANRATELAQEAKKLKLPETAYRGKEKGPAYFVLSTIATDQATAAAAQASNLIAAAAPALQILAKRQAELAVLASLASAPKAAPTSHAAAATGRTILKTSGSNNRICKAEVQPKTVYKTDCSAGARHKPKLQTIGSHILKLKKLKTVKSADIKQPKLTVTAEGEGTLSNANTWEATSDNKGCEQHSSSATTAVLAANAIAVAAVEFEATSTAQELTLAEAAAAEEASDQKVSDNERRLLTSDKELAKAIVSAQVAYKQPNKPLAEWTLAEAASTPVAKELYKALQSQKAAPKATDAATEAIAVMLFKKDAGNVGTEFLTPLTTDKHAIPGDGKAITDSTENFSAGTNFDRAMAYFYATRLPPQIPSAPGTKPSGSGEGDSAEKAEEKKDGDKKDAECTGTVETDCDTKKCDWNAEKKECKVKEGARIILTLINTPLWLAFLLL
ncbi:uncharacterized protein TEOVI_000756800 [Trypanosoma equiperdum]|uniref:Variant surface glycoprotein (VSG) n=1 Tax=Trypanosoma equiperdum TaxID=5694 RepID=A0A1G4HY36_TRYEQ|nr:hypothetical protein, conserved [Trypanosoma equiperdum]